jgi:hypothetical protein
MLCVFSSLLYANRYYFFCNQLAKLLLLLWLVSSLCKHLDLIKTPIILKKKRMHTQRLSKTGLVEHIKQVRHR